MYNLLFANYAESAFRRQPVLGLNQYSEGTIKQTTNKLEEWRESAGFSRVGSVIIS